MALGRPSILHAPAGQDQDGNDWTVGQRLVARIATGLTQADAARDTGISDDTVRNWRLKGAAARAKAERGGILTAREADYVQFLGAYESAQATAKAGLLGQIRAAGMNPAVTTTLRVKLAREKHVAEDGSVTYGDLMEVERIEETVERPGPWTALAWILERRWADEFGRRLAVELPDGSDGKSAEDRAQTLSEQVEEFLAQQDEAAANEDADVTPEA